MSMFPPIFATAAAAAPVVALLGSPLRFFLFGEATQSTAKPYAVWQTVTGYPANYLGQRPDLDRYTTQVDVYATTVSSARAVADALRQAFEGVAYITSWRGERKDPTTNNFNVSFDVEWHVPR